MAHAHVAIALDDRVVALGPVGHAHRCQLGLIDDLALLQRAAQRFGWSIRLRRVSPEMTDLLELAGLTEVLASDAPPHGA
jgi:hypothetical protein